MGSIWAPQHFLGALVSIFDWGGVGGLVADGGDVAAAVGVVNRRRADCWRRLQGNLPRGDLWNGRSGRKLSPVGLKTGTELALKTPSSKKLGFYLSINQRWATATTKPFHLPNTITTPWILPHFSRLQPQISMRLVGILSDRSTPLSGWKTTHGFQKYSMRGMHLYSSLSFTLMSHNKKTYSTIWSSHWRSRDMVHGRWENLLTGEALVMHSTNLAITRVARRKSSSIFKI